MNKDTIVSKFHFTIKIQDRHYEKQFAHIGNSLVWYYVCIYTYNKLPCFIATYDF